MAGERKSVTELGRAVEYTYDSLYRLTSETITEVDKVTVYTYAYDNVSNRILKTENGAATECVYNALNQLVSDSETSYEYDPNGNLIRVIGTANSVLYEYNAENKLVKATVQTGVLVTEESYTYDYAGNRTSKTTYKSNGEFEYVKYLNDNSSLTNVLAEIDENGTAKCVYTIGADLISQERDRKVSVYLYDGHGSVVGLANESGVVTDTYSYDAFGNLLKSTGSTKNCYRYCGEQFDETTGLYYLRARYMDTSAGRFISQDTYQGTINGPISLHKYLYANANPVAYSDPSGYTSFVELAGTMAIQGALLGMCVFGTTNVIRYILGDPATRAVYDSVGDAAISGMMDGIIYGAMLGIIGAAFLTLAPFVAIAVAFNLASSMYYYTLARSALKSHQWFEALYNLYMCVFSFVCAGAVIEEASLPEYNTPDYESENSNNESNSLFDRASELNSLFDQRAQNHRTTAVASAVDKDGNIVILVGTSLDYTPSIIKNNLAEGEIFCTPNGKGHAEMHILNYASENELTITGIAASRPVCPNCASVLDNNGIDIKSPRK